ncbi:MAG: DUF4230 domain-containing protein [Vallitalea sp.]|nr:DUF4230 domain-containing protein [Vallitalea sp.]
MSVVVIGSLLFLGIKAEIFDLFGKLIVHETKVYTEVLSEEIKDIAELCTMRFDYKDIVNFGKPKPHKGDYYVAIIQGHFIAGVNLDNVELIHSEDHKVTVKLNHAHIIDDGFDIKEVLEEDEAFIFSKMEEKKVKAENDRHEQIKQKVLNGDFLKKADKQVREIITNMLINFDFKSIQFEYY